MQSVACLGEEVSLTHTAAQTTVHTCIHTYRPFIFANLLTLHVSGLEEEIGVLEKSVQPEHSGARFYEAMMIQVFGKLIV